MTAQEILTAQMLDPFRIGLIVALLATTFRTRQTTGTVIPLIFGTVFVAALIPATMGAPSDEPLWRLVALGLLANAALIGCALGLMRLFTRRSG